MCSWPGGTQTLWSFAICGWAAAKALSVPILRLYRNSIGSCRLKAASSWKWGLPLAFPRASVRSLQMLHILSEQAPAWALGPPLSESTLDLETLWACWPGEWLSYGLVWLKVRWPCCLPALTQDIAHLRGVILEPSCRGRPWTLHSRRVRPHTPAKSQGLLSQHSQKTQDSWTSKERWSCTPSAASCKQIHNLEFSPSPSRLDFSNSAVRHCGLLTLREVPTVPRFPLRCGACFYVFLDYDRIIFAVQRWASCTSAVPLWCGLGAMHSLD